MLLRSSGNGLPFLSGARSGNAAVTGQTGFTCTVNVVSCGLIRIAWDKEGCFARVCIPLPWSESEEPPSESERATVAPKTSGKPRGNAALSGIFVLPIEIGVLTAELKKHKKRTTARHTFLGGWRVIFLALAVAFDVDLFCFSQLSAVITLCDRTALLFDLEEGTVCMSACRRPVTFDAGFAVGLK